MWRLPRGRRTWHVKYWYDTATRETLEILSCNERVWTTSDTKLEVQMISRESDYRIVPMKWGNAHGGKAVTYYHP